MTQEAHIRTQRTVRIGKGHCVVIEGCERLLGSPAGTQAERRPNKYSDFSDAKVVRVVSKATETPSNSIQVEGVRFQFLSFWKGVSPIDCNAFGNAVFM